ncbi:two-component system chemotaxis response regulator CheB [Filimonas zeae]|uniref:protein-glutamate methylesterase n=1 Tax=Filimonas zeae TaxID=1737353 RepID=A0A917MWK5_9BACT|nr:chemotaxis protein CheB [Filimonas zeae]MDR6339729.1 two-component system chemotaxis response regulator CheB [Filimonas zeae]GGH69364.1 putative chemotaxis protein-glutamate methylesterase [Filimonas zeae]
MEENRITHLTGLIVIGGSAGSLDVILRVLPLLKTTMQVPVIIVLHRKISEENILTELLTAKTNLPVKEVEDGDVLVGGTIYIAPADYHLLLEKQGGLSLDASEKINYSRPSIDVTFESAAEAFGKKLTAIILSGANADGSAGMKIVKQHGGICLAQNPATASAAYMPQYAINHVAVDSILNADEIAAYINAQ